MGPIVVPVLLIMVDPCLLAAVVVLPSVVAETVVISRTVDSPVVVGTPVTMNILRGDRHPHQDIGPAMITAHTIATVPARHRVDIANAPALPRLLKNCHEEIPKRCRRFKL